MGNVKNSMANKHIVQRWIIMLFCILIGICMAYVLINIYDPSINSIAALNSVCMDVLCTIMLFILIGSFVLDNHGLKRTTSLFMVLLVATVWAMFLDYLNWVFDGKLEFGHLTYWFTLGSFCMGAVLAGFYAMYIYSYMTEVHGLKKMRTPAIICIGLNGISFVLSFVLGLTGNAFQFVDGHYETGAFYDVITAIPIVALLFITGYAVFNVKKIGKHDAFAVTGYVLFIIVGALIEAEYSIGTTYVSMAIADVFIYVTLQNEIITMEKRNTQKWIQKSSTDGLTGLLNRYAYEEEMQRLENANLPSDFVYMSADVNSLKMVNDSLGHSAGDELIKGAAQCLSKCVSQYGKLYRIGGDEFIALISAEQNTLCEIKKKIEETTKSWNGEKAGNLTISCGYVTTDEEEKMSAREMANLADRRMYEAKREYYRNSGIDRRKKNN